MTNARKTESTEAKGKTTMNKTTNKTTSRQAKAEARTQAQIERTQAQIESVSQIDNILNQTAKEAMQAYLTDGNGDKFGRKLTQLSSIVVHCRLNKLLSSDETYRQEFVQFKNDTTQFNKYFQYVDTLETLYETQYTKDGDRITVCTDKKRVAEIYKQIEKLSCLNGSDLVQDCIVKLLDCIRKAEKNGRQLTESTLLEPFEVYDLRSKTYANGDIKPIELWTKHSTNAIKEASATVTRSINASKAIRESTTLYTAIESTVADDDGQTETVTRYKKASALSSYEITDMNGKQFAVVASDTDNKLIESIPEKANLTSREAYILKNHYIPHSYAMKDEHGKTLKDEHGKTVYTFGTLSLQQIADHYNITLTAVEKCDRNLKTKIIKANIFPQFTEADRKTDREAKAIRCYRADDESKTTVAQFESANKASKILGINKALVIQVANGKRKTANGLVFEYIK